MTLRSVFIALLCVYILTESSSVESLTSTQGPSNSWSNGRSNFNQQNLENVLLSIDERLRTLDSMYSSRYTTRWEISMEQQSRRLESIESRLGRMEALLEIRVDKITENLSSRYLKEELVKDQITRKLDSTYERLNHRLGYMEARFDMAMAKLQSNIETTMVRFEQMEAAAGNRQVDIESEIITVETNLEDLKKQMKNFEELYNTTITGSICETFHDHTYQLIATTENMKKNLNSSYVAMAFQNEQQYKSTEAAHKNIINLLTNITGEINKKTINFTNKTDSMYNEIRKKLQNTESIVKDSMSLNNATRRDVQDSYRSLLVQMGRRGIFPSDRDRQKEKETQETLEFSLDELTKTVLRRFTDLEGQLDSSFQMLQMSQNLFLETCHRIQLDEPQLEMKLIEVLEKILDTLNNRSFHIENGVENLHQLLKSHNSLIVRTLGQTTNNVKQISQQSSENMNHVEKMFLGIQQIILDANKNIENIMNDFMNENIKSTEKLDTILITIQEIQENINYNEQENITELLTETSDELQKLRQLVDQIHQECDRQYHEEETLNITFVKLLIQEIVKSSNMCYASDALNTTKSEHDKSSSNLINGITNKIQEKQEITENNSGLIISVNKLTEQLPENITLTYSRNNHNNNVHKQPVQYQSHGNVCNGSNETECGNENQPAKFLSNTNSENNDTGLNTTKQVTINILPRYAQNMNYSNILTHEKINNTNEEFIRINLDNVAAIMHNVNTDTANHSYATPTPNYKFLNIGNLTILIEGEHNKQINYNPEITLTNNSKINQALITNNITKNSYQDYGVKNNILQNINSSEHIPDILQSETEQNVSQNNDYYSVSNNFQKSTEQYKNITQHKSYNTEHTNFQEEKQYAMYSTIQHPSLKENKNITSYYVNESTSEISENMKHNFSTINTSLTKPTLQTNMTSNKQTIYNTGNTESISYEAGNMPIYPEAQRNNITMRISQIYDKQHGNNALDEEVSQQTAQQKIILNTITDENFHESEYEQHEFSTDVKKDKTV